MSNNHTFEIIPLTIEARGEVINSNINEFRELVREALGNINRDLKTDEQFGQAELDVKALKGAEDAVKSAKDKALQDAESLHALFLAMDETCEEIRAPRLELEKLIAKRKEEVKAELVEDALATFDIDAMDARRNFLKPLQDAMKGKRTLDSMRTALRIYATTRQAVIGKSREVIERIENAHGTELTLDKRALELLTPDAVEAELRRRFEARKAAAEAARLQAEAAAAKAEAAKAQAELAEANKPPAPAPLPEPPKIGSIPTGANAAPAGESNVVPFQAPQAAAAATEVAGPSAADEWAGFTATLFAGLAQAKEARANLKHAVNVDKAGRFAAGLGELWKAVNAVEVAL